MMIQPQDAARLVGRRFDTLEDPPVIMEVLGWQVTAAAAGSEDEFEVTFQVSDGDLLRTVSDDELLGWKVLDDAVS